MKLSLALVPALLVGALAAPTLKSLEEPKAHEKQELDVSSKGATVPETGENRLVKRPTAADGNKSVSQSPTKDPDEDESGGKKKGDKVTLAARRLPGDPSIQTNHGAGKDDDSGVGQGSGQKAPAQVRPGRLAKPKYRVKTDQLPRLHHSHFGPSELHYHFNIEYRQPGHGGGDAFAEEVQHPVIQKPKTEEPKVEKTKGTGPEVEETKAAEPETKEIKKEQSKEESKVEKTKAEVSKVEEPETEEPETQESDTEEPEAKESKEEESKEEESKEEPKDEEPEAENQTKAKRSTPEEPEAEVAEDAKRPLIASPPQIFKIYKKKDAEGDKQPVTGRRVKRSHSDKSEAAESKSKETKTEASAWKKCIAKFHEAYEKEGLKVLKKIFPFLFKDGKLTEPKGKGTSGKHKGKGKGKDHGKGKGERKGKKDAPTSHDTSSKEGKTETGAKEKRSLSVTEIDTAAHGGKAAVPVRKQEKECKFEIDPAVFGTCFAKLKEALGIRPVRYEEPCHDDGHPHSSGRPTHEGQSSHGSHSHNGGRPSSDGHSHRGHHHGVRPSRGDHPYTTNGGIEVVHVGVEGSEDYRHEKLHGEVPEKPQDKPQEKPRGGACGRPLEEESGHHGRPHGPVPHHLRRPQHVGRPDQKQPEEGRPAHQRGSQHDKPSGHHGNQHHDDDESYHYTSLKGHFTHGPCPENEGGKGHPVTQDEESHSSKKPVPIRTH